ncbi:MAG: VapC toxin family PIN domain ribonuclease [Chloroflexi bacterium]|nr:VapC toxin family PIN domain ribonuclease [Chloroflexota bacterium]
MNIFVDTSAFLALLDEHEQNHLSAQRIWIQLAQQDTLFFCTNYILSETAALVQNRLGIPQIRAFHENVAPFLQVIWVNERLHNAGMTAVLTANRRQLSLVDCIKLHCYAPGKSPHSLRFRQPLR